MNVSGLMKELRVYYECARILPLFVNVKTYNWLEKHEHCPICSGKWVISKKDDKIECLGCTFSVSDLFED